MSTEILMPALSPTMTEGKLAKWLKKEGDAIKSGDVIAEIETDKATMEMEAVDEGVLGKILVDEGAENVKVNVPIAVLLAEGESAADIPKTKPAASTAPKPEAAPEPAPEAPKAEAAPSPSRTAPPAAPKKKGERIFASPLAKRLAQDAGLDLGAIEGSGPHGRIVRADVDKATASGTGKRAGKAAASATDDFSQPFTAVANSGMRKVIAKRLVEAKTTIPHFYLTIDCDIGELLTLRKKLNERADGDVKLSVNDFVIKASALALRKVPQVNASWTDEAVHLYDNVDVSIAVATPEGLITPIIRRADEKSVAVISNEMRDLAARAKAKKLRLEEFQGGGFSISNLGMFGIREFSAIVNPPQVAILAVGKGEERAVVRGGQLAIANMMTCTLSCDHRVVDGAVGAEFLQAVQRYIEDPLRMLI